MKIYFERQKKNRHTYLILESEEWDDYGIKSMFDLSISIDGEITEIGEIKIIDENKNTGRVVIKEGSASFPLNFCSLGQSIDYYKAIHRLGDVLEKEILTILRDCAYDEDIYKQFHKTPQFKSSVVRFSRAEQALQFAQKRYSQLPDNVQTEASYSFQFKTKVPGFSTSHILDFEFFDPTSSQIPSNVNVLIGRNGTGKTQILSDLAKAISGYGYANKQELLAARSRKFPKDRPSFGNTIVVSYSAFDMFEIPGRTKHEQEELQKQGHIFGYKYCGLRERVKGDQYRIKSSEEVANEFVAAVDAISKKDNDDEWQECLRHVLDDPSFSSIDPRKLTKIFPQFSSGQKIILSILAKIFEHIEPASIVIVDEPETHLHPSLMAAFIHSLRAILELYKSYAIIATHSPVVLQETPSRFVQVLSVNASVKRLRSESFGEEISTLTEDVFGVAFEESNFYSVLKKLADEGMTLDQINRLFGKKLGLTARSFVADAS